MAILAAYEQPAILVQPALGNKSPLCMLLEWRSSRDEGRPGSVGPDVPAHATVQTQFEVLCKRLRVANVERPYSERWLNGR